MQCLRRKSQHIQNHSQDGFTLTELLAATAIIGLLAAILFPVFSKAREGAKKGTCINNLKQIGLGISMYLGDHDDRVPQATTFENPTVLWHEKPAMGAYMKSKGNLHCPSAPNPVNGSNYALNPYIFEPEQGNNSSNYCWMQNGFQVQIPTTHAFSIIERPANTIAALETGGNGEYESSIGSCHFRLGAFIAGEPIYHRGNLYQGNFNSTAFARHFAERLTPSAEVETDPKLYGLPSGGTLNTLYTDGHVKGIKIISYTRESELFPNTEIAARNSSNAANSQPNRMPKRSYNFSPN